MKIQSRKFIAWLAWYALVVASFVITKTVNDTLIGWFGVITVVYIGGNVAQKIMLPKIPSIGGTP